MGFDLFKLLAVIINFVVDLLKYFLIPEVNEANDDELEEEPKSVRFCRPLSQEEKQQLRKELHFAMQQWQENRLGDFPPP